MKQPECLLSDLSDCQSMKKGYERRAYLFTAAKFAFHKL